MTSMNIQRDVVLLPLQAVSGVVERRHTLPILSNVLLELKDGRLSLTATDLEIQVVSTTVADGETTEEATTVSARKLQDILRALPEGASMQLNIQDKRIQLKAGRSKFSLQTMPAADFPKIAAGSAVAVQFDVAQRDLKRLLGHVHYSMAQQDIRYYLNGLLLAVESNVLTVVATDGHRLALARAAFEQHVSSSKTEVILPRKAVLELFKLLADSDAKAAVTIRDNQVSFKLDGAELTSKVVDGKFPDYQKVIPTGYTKHFVLDRVALQGALQRAAILSNEKFRGVRWFISENGLRIVSSNTEQEEAEEELEIEYNGEPLDIGFNVSYLLDVLGNFDSKNVECWVGDANSSMLLTMPEEPDFKYVVMPMRI
ncbi:MAG TPA: DNA polymerase III subunit beta [Burkholderiales bacterium]|nr:DNA polymerase III subunit beta [Burkholderiales bacterium]